ncbi:metal binding domain of Ada-domain-containing protein [Xylaria intraflava]|nr:metal binding domain of Ada-domain-containing protein [Xylaria intraflava]
MARGDAVAIPRENHTGSIRRVSPFTDEFRWRLVLAHTPTTNFLYGVVSTQIFCRPSCPSRRPRRANVRFFDSASSAVAAGFRACRRCRPESTDPSHESPRASAEKQVEAACEYLRRKRGDVQMLDLAAHVGLSPRYLHGLFKRITGTTPGVYAAAMKQESVGAHAAQETPVLDIPDPALQIIDCPGAADFVPVDANVWETSLQDLDWNLDNRVPEGFDTGFDGIHLNQEEYPEWINYNDPGVMSLLEGNTDSLERPTDTQVSDCVDPSLLTT